MHPLESDDTDQALAALRARHVALAVADDSRLLLLPLELRAYLCCFFTSDLFHLLRSTPLASSTRTLTAWVRATLDETVWHPVLRALAFAGDWTTHRTILDAIPPTPVTDSDCFAFFNGNIMAIGKIKTMLADPRVDPTEKDQMALYRAAANGHDCAVACLLADSRINPSMCRNASLRVASQNGHDAVVVHILAHPRVDPAYDGSSFLLLAASHGHSAVVARLLADQRIDPTGHDHAALMSAAENGHTITVGLLISDPRVDPAASCYRAIRSAALLGRHSVVNLLLADRRVNPSGCAKFIDWARSRGFCPVGM